MPQAYRFLRRRGWSAFPTGVGNWSVGELVLTDEEMIDKAAGIYVRLYGEVA